METTISSFTMRDKTWGKEDDDERLKQQRNRREDMSNEEKSGIDTPGLLVEGDGATPEYPDNENERRWRCSRICPPQTKLARYLLVVGVCGFASAVLYSVTHNQGAFSLVGLATVAWIAGEIVTRIRLPALLGMLIVGITFSNIPNLNLASTLQRDWSSSLRSLALTIIMTRAGLGLDSDKLKAMKYMALAVAILPCVADALAAGAAAYWLLGYPILGCFSFGFVMAGLSPAVVVPILLGLQERGLGVSKGIPTLGIFAVGVDNAVAVCLFGIFLSLTFSNNQLWFLIISGPLQIVAGILYGVCMGFISWYLPNQKSKWVTLPRFALLFSGSLFAVYQSRDMNVGGAGVIGALVFAAVAAYRWRQDTNGGDASLKAVARIYNVMWLIMQPVLFGLIGAEINLSMINPRAVGFGVAAMFIGIAARMLVVGISVARSGFNWREIIYMLLINFPKATVQATIGGLLLATAREHHASVEAERMGSETLTMAALSILITSPLGSVLMSLTADKLLGRTSTPPDVAVETDDDDAEQR